MIKIVGVFLVSALFFFSSCVDSLRSGCGGKKAIDGAFSQASGQKS